MSNSTHSSRKEKLSEAQRALLEARVKGRPENSPKAGGEVEMRKPQAEPDRLSFAQERMWFLSQLNPRSPAYTMHEAVRVKGPLNLALLQKSLDRLVLKHSILRTTFHTVGQELVQKISADIKTPIETIDLCDLPEEERESHLASLAKEAAQTVFDLDRGPLLKLSLVKLGELEHALLLSLNHIISDEWSNKLFWRELGDGLLGEAVIQDAAPQYVDFAYWQRKAQAEGLFNQQMEYWKQRLSGAPALLQLPVDRPRPAVQSLGGGLVTLSLPDPLAAELHALSVKSGTTLFMTLLAVFKVLLFRYTGQTDIVVGTPIANRSQPEFEKIVGLFLNTLVLRTNLSGDPSFAELLTRVRQTSVEAFSNPDLPFEKLVEALRPQRDPSYSPLFQTMFVYQDDPAGAIRLPGLRAEPLFVDGEVSKFDLTLFAYKSGTGLNLAAEYSSDLFDRQTVERLLVHLRELARAAVTDPTVSISALSILTADERNLLLREWNRTEMAYPQELCIHNMIETHAARRPEAPAVIFRDSQLTYGELDRRANQVAHALQKAKIAQGSLVGLCFERSFEMIIGMLGALKAGAGYVPLDPSYPKDRLNLVLEDVQAQFVLTQVHLQEDLPSGPWQIFALDRDWPQFAQLPETKPVESAGPEDLAYIIYTSGSTGRPKGVPVSHRNLVHSTAARLAYYPDPTERFLLLSSFAFDSSVVGIYGSLCQGGTLCLPEQGDERDVSRVAELIERFGVTDTLCLPSLYTLLLLHTSPHQLASLRTVIVAGEACPSPLVQQHYATLPQAQLYNEYGPTEGTVWSSVSLVRPDFAGRNVPIGRPVPNMGAYILDRHLQPVPIGVTGELYISGEGLVKGYYKRPDLTAERFIQHTFYPHDTVRLYKTGDLARYLADGNIEFLGRADHQVKIRGYRIELEEIEAVLHQHPGVRDAAVVAMPGAISAKTIETLAGDPGTLTEAVLSLGLENGLRVVEEVEMLSDATCEVILQKSKTGKTTE